MMLTILPEHVIMHAVVKTSQQNVLSVLQGFPRSLVGFWRRRRQRNGRGSGRKRNKRPGKRSEVTKVCLGRYTLWQYKNPHRFKQNVTVTPSHLSRDRARPYTLLNTVYVMLINNQHNKYIKHVALHAQVSIIH